MQLNDDMFLITLGAEALELYEKGYEPEVIADSLLRDPRFTEFVTEEALRACITEACESTTEVEQMNHGFNAQHLRETGEDTDENGGNDASEE